VHNLVGNAAIEDCPLNHLHSDLHSINSVAPNISGCIDQLAEVNLAVLDSNETNKVSPGYHFEQY
jgi:hypothetical protein